MIETEKMRPRVILLGRLGQETRESFTGQEMRNRSDESPREYSFESRIRTKERMFVRDIGYPLRRPGLRAFAPQGPEVRVIHSSSHGSSHRAAPSLQKLEICLGNR